MKFIVGFSRIFVGVLFIFSGLVKANDPLGLSYKMQEFFEVWGMDALSGYALFFSIVIIAFEIVAGIAVLVAWNMRLVNWLLLLLILFFTFLTGYAVLSGKIRECGCFGDCIPLTAEQSFMKDLILLVLILFLFFKGSKIKQLFGNNSSVAILISSSIFSLGFMWYTLNYLPLVDCLPYKAGSSILKNMQIPDGAIPDSTVITFVYNKAGKEIEFTADKFPSDFSDTTYQFVKRYDKLVRPGNAMPKIKDFSLNDIESGMDMTQLLLNDSSYKLVLFIRHGYKATDWKENAEPLMNMAIKKKVQPWVVTSLSKDETLSFLGTTSKGFSIYTCDATAIKTAARSNPAVFVLHRDTILGKWSYPQFKKAAQYLSNLK